jgi:hypothetical protein
VDIANKPEENKNHASPIEPEKKKTEIWRENERGKYIAIKGMKIATICMEH